MQQSSRTLYPQRKCGACMRSTPKVASRKAVIVGLLVRSVKTASILAFQCLAAGKEFAEDCKVHNWEIQVFAIATLDTLAPLAKDIALSSRVGDAVKWMTTAHLVSHVTTFHSRVQSDISNDCMLLANLLLAPCVACLAQVSFPNAIGRRLGLVEYSFVGVPSKRHEGEA